MVDALPGGFINEIKNQGRQTLGRNKDGMLNLRGFVADLVGEVRI